MFLRRTARKTRADSVGHRMNILNRLFCSSLGKKYLLALTGAVLLGFVTVHLLGNLQIFLGPDPLNAYAHFLQSKPGLLWSVRLLLLFVVALHIFLAIRVSLENAAARPVAYVCYEPADASLASRTMIWTGLIVAVFIVYHLLHFTVKITNPEYGALRDAEGRPDVYRMMILGFSNVWISGVYMVGVGLLSYHLSHAINSLFQSLGLRNRTFAPILERLSKGAAILYFLGNLLIPVAVLTGILK
jgi:succinate dehydrogenase / fumarate reductase, cytochrome b subunit